jgi:transposase, IS5 family
LDQSRDCATLQRQGPARVETRFVIRLLLLKHIYGLSEEGVCGRWVYDVYF